MKKQIYILSIVVLALFIKCERPPDYSNTPFIMFESLERAGPTSMSFTFYYQDGNADLGLDNSGSDLEAPFNPSFFVLADSTDPCIYKDTVDNLDDAAPGSISVKTLNNKNGRNIDLTVFVKRDSAYEPIFFGINEFACENDTVFNPSLRFPRVSDKLIDEPIDGKITFTVDFSLGFFLSTDSLLVEFSIKDRELNQSNTVRSIPFRRSP